MSFRRSPVPATTVPAIVLGPDSKTWPIHHVSAVIDYLTIAINLSSPSNMQSVQRKLGMVLAGKPAGKRAWVKAIDLGAGNATSHFHFEVHDVNNFPDLQRTLQRLARLLPIVGEPLLVNIEVAVDFYAELDLSEADARQLFAAIASRYHVEGKKRWQHHCDDTITYLDCRGTQIDGYATIYNGYKDEPNQRKMYFKDFDRGTLIPFKDHRTRVETTLLQSDLDWRGLRRVSDLANFDFRTLSDHFQFRLPDKLPTGCDLQSVIVSALGDPKRQGVQILSATGRRHHGRTRTYSKFTRADSYLTARGGQALHGLRKRFTRICEQIEV